MIPAARVEGEASRKPRQTLDRSGTAGRRPRRPRRAV